MRLFDLRADPLERSDVAGERPDDVARLLRAFEAWREAHPTPGYADARADAARREALKALGYTGFDTGIDEEH